MIKSGFMDKLLDGVEVEWKSLGEVYKFQYGTGNTIPTSGGQYPVYGSNGIVGTHNEFNSEDSPIIGHIGAYAGIVNWGKGKHFVTYNGVICKLINKLVNPKYAYYQLLKQDFNSMAKSASHPFVSYDTLNKVLIPIPPLKVQEEIVRILDTFTEHTAELTAELTARNKQYTYYRDKLLTFEEGQVEWKSLGRIGEFVRGNGLQKSDFVESGVGCIHYGQIYTYYGNFAYETKSFVSPTLATKLRKAQKGDLIIATTSENIEDVCKPLVWLGEDEVCISGETYVFKHNQNPKYLAYYLQTPMFFDYKKKNRTGTKVIRVHGDKLGEFRVPIPSLTEQERIVTILDKFYALTSSVTEGLPREIELRKKQYEFYRNMLLSFPKSEVEA